MAKKPVPVHHSDDKARIAEKLKKEITISSLLQDEFSRYNLKEGSSFLAGAETFKFIRFKKKEWPNKTLIIFSGLKHKEVCKEVKEYLLGLGHSLSDHKKDPEKGLVISLSNVAASKTVETVSKTKVTKSPQEMATKLTSREIELFVKGDESLSKAVTLIEKFHRSRLILGVRNRDNCFKKTEDGSLVVYWNYANILEATRTLYESEKLFGYVPSTKKASRGEEVIVVWDLSKIPLDIDRRKFRVFKKRTVEGDVEISPIQIVDFLCRKVMRLNPNFYTPNTCQDDYPVGCFHVKDEKSRRDIFERLDQFKVTYLSSEKDGGCFWVAKTPETISAFHACTSNGDIKPTELIKRIKSGEIVPTLTKVSKKMRTDNSPSVGVKEDEQYSPDEAKAIVKRILREAGLYRNGADRISLIKVSMYKGAVVVPIYFKSKQHPTQEEVKVVEFETKNLEGLSVSQTTIHGKPSKNLFFYFSGNSKKPLVKEKNLSIEPSKAVYRRVRKALLKFLKSNNLERTSGKDPNDYRINVNLNSRKLALSGLSRKAKEFFSDPKTLPTLLGVDGGITKAGFLGLRGATSETFQIYFETSSDSSTEVLSVQPERPSQQKTNQKEIWSKSLEILRKADLSMHHRDGDADYRRSSRNQRRIPLTSLSKKARIFLTDNAHLFSKIHGVKSAGFHTLDGQDSENFSIIFNEGLMESTLKRGISSEVTKKTLIQKSKIGSKDMPSHVRMFMALSNEDQMECLEQSGLANGGKEESLKRLKGFFLIDASKGKSLYDVAKTLGALVKPEDIL